MIVTFKPSRKTVGDTGIFTNRFDMPDHDTNDLGHFLRDRRARLDPREFGLSTSRRRTPGLRREEVAQRADISVTWYTWLEQGRGRHPSTDLLERVSDALQLSALERDHMFLLAQKRLPHLRYSPPEPISYRLQKVLDALDPHPAYVKTAIWDVLGWNRAAAILLTDYAEVPAERRNILRILFCDPRARVKLPDWEGDARFAVAAFRSDATRAGALAAMKLLVDELRGESPEFDDIWRDNDLHAHEGVKTMLCGTDEVRLEYTSFAVQGQPDLSLSVYTPVSPKDASIVERAVVNSD